MPRKVAQAKATSPLSQIIVCVACLSVGFLLGMNYGFTASNCNGSNFSGVVSPQDDESKCQQLKTNHASLHLQVERLQQTLHSVAAKTTATTEDRFSNNVHDFVEGMAYLNRSDFFHRFDMGVPVDPSTKQNDKVLLLYSDGSALPLDETAKQQARHNTGPAPTLEVSPAVQNCHFLNVILLQPKRPNQCTAIVGQYSSYHIQKWMRLPNKGKNEYGKMEPNIPLQLVNRGAQASGRKSTKIPSGTETRRYRRTLNTYLSTLPDVLRELKPIAARVAKQNTIVVMTCNHGQSELLINFVCAARYRKLDISTVLVFATDEDTRDLAEGMGLAVFFDKTNYGKSPTGAAGRYGDETFTAMMMAKVYCVQMVSELGYDVLFQDVDMIWYKDPLEYFHDENSPSHGFDIYFQDDGNRAVYYAPYSANTGFYYVRANDLTRYFFNSLLMSGDLIFTTHSHQIALVALLSEYASKYGMKPKVLSRDTDEFPGGHAYHSRPDFMKKLVQGEVHPYIFHMSWTENKDNKKKYMRQMGEWYVKDKCITRRAGYILDQTGPGAPGSLVAPCCSAEPLFSCHYKDKPSREPCPDAPLIDPEKGKSFW